MSKVFVLTGPESSGKTWLSERLSEVLQGTLVKEFAREYLEDTGGAYLEKDIDIFAREQKKRMDRASQESSLVIADTGPLVLKVWSEVRFDRASTFIEEWWSSNEYYYLLCSPDLEWEFDPLRENPDNRDELFMKYYLCLESSKKDFVVIEGKEGRLTAALQWIESKL